MITPRITNPYEPGLPALGDDLENYLVTPDEIGWTALHDSARYGPRDVFITLVNRASQPALNQALILPTQNCSTALHLAARYCSEDDFIVLINRASQQALDNALCKPTATGWTLLHIVARLQFVRLR